MKLRSLITSISFHVGILVVTGLGLTFMPQKPLVAPTAMSVEIVKVEKKKVKSVKPKTKPKPKAKKPKPKPAPKNTSKTPVSPVKDVKKDAVPPPPKDAEVKPKLKEDKKVKKPEVKPPPEQNKKAAVKSEEKPKPKEKPKEEVAPTKKDFGSVLKNLADVEPEAEVDPKAKETPNDEGGDAIPMNSSELGALQAQLESCWNIPIGARGIADMIIDVNIIVLPNKQVQSARVVNVDRYNTDSFFRAVADTAVRAVYSPQCATLNLPDGKYDQWKNIIVEFNPRDMF